MHPVLSLPDQAVLLNQCGRVPGWCGGSPGDALVQSSKLGWGRSSAQDVSTTSDVWPFLSSLWEGSSDGVIPTTQLSCALLTAISLFQQSCFTETSVRQWISPALGNVRTNGTGMKDSPQRRSWVHKIIFLPHNPILHALHWVMLYSMSLLSFS